jgi:hypothetical protein
MKGLFCYVFSKCTTTSKEDEVYFHPVQSGMPEPVVLFIIFCLPGDSFGFYHTLPAVK